MCYLRGRCCRWGEGEGGAAGLAHAGGGAPPLGALPWPSQDTHARTAAGACPRLDPPRIYTCTRSSRLPLPPSRTPHPQARLAAVVAEQLKRHISTWDVLDVCNWVEAIGFLQYRKKIAHNGCVGWGAWGGGGWGRGGGGGLLPQWATLLEVPGGKGPDVPVRLRCSAAAPAPPPLPPAGSLPRPCGRLPCCAASTAACCWS